MAYSETLTALLAERYLDAEISNFHRGQLWNWSGLCLRCAKCNLFLQGGAASDSLRDTLIANLGALGENGPQSHPYLAITEAYMPALCTGSCTDPCKACVRPHQLQVPPTKQRCLEGALEHPLSKEPPMQLNTFKRCGILKGLIFRKWFAPFLVWIFFSRESLHPLGIPMCNPGAESRHTQRLDYPLAGKAGADDVHSGRNSIPGNYDGVPLIRIQGLPKNPYGAHLSGGCIGAAQTLEGQHCKSPISSLPKPPFNFWGALASKPPSSDESLCNPGFNYKQCCHTQLVEDRTGYRTEVAYQSHVDTICLSDEHASQLYCMHQLTCMCSKDCICNSHDHAVCFYKNDFFTLAAVHDDLNPFSSHPKVQLQGGYLHGSIAQAFPPFCSFVSPPCLRARLPVMPVSPAELLLERQMIRLRTDLQHGPVQEDAQLIADMQRQYRDREEDLEHRRATRSRSREPIRRRSQYELNRLMRGQAPPVAKPGAVANRPVTPPKSPSPVL